jgi:hypothetical protein
VLANRQVFTAPVCARCTPSCRTARARLWICGQRKSVAHIPTGATINNNHQFDCLRKPGLRPSPSYPGDLKLGSHDRHHPPPFFRGFGQPLTTRKIGSYLGYTGRAANVVGRAVVDPKSRGRIHPRADGQAAHGGDVHCGGACRNAADSRVNIARFAAKEPGD